MSAPVQMAGFWTSVADRKPIAMTGVVPEGVLYVLFAQATMYEAVLEPWRRAVIPPDWWQAVRALDKSITVGHSFCNRANFSAHMEDLLKRL